MKLAPRPMCFVFAVLVSGTASLTAHAAPATVHLARGGKAAVDVVHAEDASQPVAKFAATLADYLGRISGGQFNIATGDGRTGIAVGTVDDFPALKLREAMTGRGIAADQQYILRSHPRGLYVVGVSDEATSYGIWDLLHRLGYRQYFPGETWEFIPDEPNLHVAVDAHEMPDYAYRRIWPGYGTWGTCRGRLNEWYERNRMPGTFVLNTGHAYGGIIRGLKQHFDEHPEFYALVNGERKGSKMCLSNPALRKLIVDHFRQSLQKHREKNDGRVEVDCLSVEPSDGGGWCECEPCAKIGSPSNLALLLANDVSAMLEREFPDTYCALYAYNEHAPPPTLRARPNVIVNVATSFIRGGFSLDQILEGWHRQGVRQMGIRGYYSVCTWDRDLPARMRGALLDYHIKTLPKWHGLGIRLITAEASDNWGPAGLGYYVASRIMWDVDEAERVDAIVDEFLTNCFGPAAEAMRPFYAVLTGRDRRPLLNDTIGRMFRWLQDTRQMADSASIHARIDALVLYMQYIVMYRDYAQAQGDARQQAFDDLFRHVWRMHETQMVHSLGLWRDLPNRDRKVRMPAEHSFLSPEGKNPLRPTDRYTRADIDRMLREGVKKHRLIEFEPRQFSRNLVPATRLGLEPVKPLRGSQRGRSTQAYWTWFDEAPTELALTITGGLIAHYRDRGNVRTRLYAVDMSDPDEPEETLVDQDESVPPDGKPREVTLQVTRPGLHKLTVNDGGDMTRIEWPDDVPHTVERSQRRSPSRTGRDFGYFYVPPGTPDVVGYGGSSGGFIIRDADGRVVLNATRDMKNDDHFLIPVPSGQDGRLWSFHMLPESMTLLTVPPYTADSLEDLLLPAEVIEQGGM